MKILRQNLQTHQTHIAKFVAILWAMASLSGPTLLNTVMCVTYLLALALGIVSTLEPHYNTYFGVHSDISVKIFYRNKHVKKRYNIAMIDGIERIDSTTLLGVIFNENLSWSPYINHILSQISQRFYLLTQLKSMSLNKSSLDQVFCALILSRVRYALQAFSGNLLCSEINKIDARFRKAHRWGWPPRFTTSLKLQLMATNVWFRGSSRTLTACAHLFQNLKLINDRYQLRNNNNNYVRLLIKNEQYINSFIPRNFK